MDHGNKRQQHSGGRHHGLYHKRAIDKKPGNKGVGEKTTPGL